MMANLVTRDDVGNIVCDLWHGFMDITFHEVIPQVNMNY